MVRPKDVQLYVTEEGKSPVEDWLEGLRDRKARAAIDAPIGRLRLGLMGQVREISERVHELKVDVRHDYRVYSGNISNLVVLLALRRDKRTQKIDIKPAKEFWLDYQERAEEE